MIKNIKAQISVEFIILLAIFMLFFQATILPTIEFSENIIKDTHSLSIASDNVSRLITHIENFSNSPGYGKRSVFFYLPENATITFCGGSENNIKYNVKISTQNPIPLTCDSTGDCNFTKNIETSLDVSCLPTKIGPGFSGNIILEKTSTGEIKING